MTVTREELERFIDEVRDEVTDPKGGIYGPGSISWEIGKESALFLGGGRAVLLQLAHPFVAHAVDQHSLTREDPLGRFQRTFDRVFAIVFGDLDDAIRAARRVHRVHEKILGEVTENVGVYSAGTAYEANDPAALFWVHATLIDSAILAYDLTVRPLSEDEKNSYYVQSKRFARLFGIPEAAMPADWSEFCSYMTHMLEESDVIEVGAPARQMAHFLFSSPSRSRRPLFAWAKVVTTGMLPERLRRGYGLEYGPAEERRFIRSLARVQRYYKLLPPRLRYTPAYVRAERRMQGKKGRDRLGYFIERMIERAIDTGRDSESAPADARR